MLKQKNKMIRNYITLFEVRKKFLIMSLWANRFNINKFPKKLKSLNENNPTANQISDDYNKLLSFSNHPAYITFCLGYNPNNSCKKE